MNPHVDYILTCVGVMVTAITCVVCVACVYLVYLICLMAINSYNNLRRMEMEAASSPNNQSGAPPMPQEQELQVPTPHLNGMGRFARRFPAE